VSCLLRWGRMLIDAPFNSVTHDVIGAAIEVHRVLGPGLLESVYTLCLQYELNARKIRFITQRQLPIVYKGIVLDAIYRLDFVVEDLVVVEVKSIAAFVPVHEAQLLTLFESQRATGWSTDQLQRSEARGRRKTSYQPEDAESLRPFVSVTPFLRVNP